MKILSMPAGGLSRNYLFKDGVLNVVLNAYAYRPNGSTAATVNGSVSIVSDKLRLSRAGGNSGCTAFITAPIDVTNVNGIQFTIDSDNNLTYMYGCVTLVNENNFTEVNNITCTTPRAGTIWTVDTSALTGNYCFVIHVRNSNSNAGYVDISEIVLI